MGQAAHQDPCSNEQIDLFKTRGARLRRMGFDTLATEDLAELLHFRDVTSDDRLMCEECRHFTVGRCTNHEAAWPPESRLHRVLVPLLQRCQAAAASS